MILAGARSALVALLAFTAPELAAQSRTATLTVGPGVLTAGQSASISFHDPSMAGQTVVIDIDNGLEHRLETDVIKLVLDGDGRGTTSWVVPNWFGANFNAPGVTEVHRAIL